MSFGDSIIIENAIREPDYCPYCMRCPGLVRMVKIEQFLWKCKCGAIHDAREDGHAVLLKMNKPYENLKAEVAKLSDEELATLLDGMDDPDRTDDLPIRKRLEAVCPTSTTLNVCVMQEAVCRYKKITHRPPADTKCVHQMPVYCGRSKEWRVLNITTGTVYSPVYTTEQAASRDIDEGEVRGNLGIVRRHNHRDVAAMLDRAAAAN